MEVRNKLNEQKNTNITAGKICSQNEKCNRQKYLQGKLNNIGVTLLRKLVNVRDCFQKVGHRDNHRKTKKGKLNKWRGNLNNICVT